MTTKKNIITTILAAALLVSMTGIAGAEFTNDISSEPMTQMIPIGAVGTYIISVNTTVLGNHTIGFTTFDPSILANLTGNGVDTGALAQHASGTWNATHAGVYTFNYMVQPQNGATPGQTQPMWILDTFEYGTIMLSANVVVSTTPIPELPAFALAGIGAVVGLIALGRRKD